jgi:hypothetical protein
MRSADSHGKYPRLRDKWMIIGHQRRLKNERSENENVFILQNPNK